VLYNTKEASITALLELIKMPKMSHSQYVLLDWISKHRTRRNCLIGCADNQPCNGQWKLSLQNALFCVKG
jgi:hypothetical protein